MRKPALILIILLAAALRIVGLDQAPPNLSWDEVSLGYNSWSILKTGADEYGTRLPFLFRAFDEYKLPGYIYTAVPFELIFGLNEWGVRLPSAVFGTLTVLIIYYLSHEFFPQQKNIALYSALLLAINPWHINFSRGAFETCLSLFFLAAGFLYLLWSIKRPRFLVIAALFLVFACSTYYTARIVTLPILVTFLITFRQKIFSPLMRNWFIIALIAGIIFSFPLVKTYFSKSGLARTNQVSIFVHDRSLAQEYSLELLRKGNGLLPRLVYNRRIADFLKFSDNYLRSFSPDFLFINGAGATGLFYLWQVITLLIGFKTLYSSKTGNKRFLWILLIAIPIGGGLSIGAPNAIRNLPLVLPLTLISAAGVEMLLRVRKWIIVPVLMVIGFSLLRFGFLYYDYTAYSKAADWGDGYPQLARYLSQRQSDYDQIWVSGYYWRPYIHLLFHQRYDPQKYQKIGSPLGFANYKFGKASWDPTGIDLGQADLKQLERGRTLFVLAPQEYDNQIEKTYIIIRDDQIDGRLVANVFRAIELDKSK